jgi:serine/threonine protein kinase
VGERVGGKLLRDALERAMPADLYLGRLRRLVGAVARAHEAGISIGDISGATVLVEDEARLVLGRLSLSQVPTFGPHGQTLAPEIIRGEVDPRDPAAAEALDLYGLGCIAIEMACGTPPFADDDRERELEGHASEPPPRISDLRPDLPSELSDLVDWLVAKHPRARPRTARDVLTQVEAVIERTGATARTLRVLIVEDDTARARWLWGIARRAHAATIVEIASEGTDAAHKLNRDQPDLVFINGKLRGVMNALELCMYARGLESGNHTLGDLFVIGDVAAGDASLFEGAEIQTLADDDNLPNVLIERIRSALLSRPRTRPSRTTISG